MSGHKEYPIKFQLPMNVIPMPNSSRALAQQMRSCKPRVVLREGWWRIEHHPTFIGFKFATLPAWYAERIVKAHAFVSQMNIKRQKKIKLQKKLTKST